MDNTVLFESQRDEYYDRYVDFLSEQVGKYYHFIHSAVVFIGSEINEKLYSQHVSIKFEFDPLTLNDREVHLILDMHLVGRAPEKIEFAVHDESSFDSSIWLGRLIFNEFPSWTEEDERKLLDSKNDPHV